MLLLEVRMTLHGLDLLGDDLKLAPVDECMCLKFHNCLSEFEESFVPPEYYVLQYLTT